MKILKDRIASEGLTIGTEIVKVDGFLNHRLDVFFLEEIGREFARRFSGVKIDKILTAEAGGIAVACLAARFFDYIPVVFAKKALPGTVTEGFYQAEAKSFTRGAVSLLCVSEHYLDKGDRVLIIDDFLAHGEASSALAAIVESAGAKVQGIGVVIEKSYQGGSKKLRDMGYDVRSLAVIEKIENGNIIFAE